MEITDRTDGDVHVLVLEGELDSDSSPALEAHLLDLVRAGQVRLVLDVQAVRYVSSAGLRVLLVALQGARQGGGDLVLAGVQDPFAEILAAVKFDTLFAQHPSVAEATRLMRGG